MFSAHVQKPSNAMYAVVMFNFKKRQKVKTKYLIPIGGAVPRPELAVSRERIVLSKCKMDIYPKHFYGPSFLLV